MQPADLTPPHIDKDLITFLEQVFPCKIRPTGRAGLITGPEANVMQGHAEVIEHLRELYSVQEGED